MSVAPTRPAANSTMSLITWRPSSVSVTQWPPGSALALFTRQPNRRATPRSRRSCMNSSTSSWSTNGSIWSVGSSTVTLMSSALKIEAYSRPITLAPITVSWRGIIARSRISSLSTTLTPSKPMCAGR